jgi:hypothetical protein
MNMTLLSRLARHAFVGRNRLATSGDRFEGFVLVAAVAVALLAIPVAAATGSEVYATQRAQAEQQRFTRHRVEAVLVEDTPAVIGFTMPGGVVEVGPVPATWRSPDGLARQGRVHARFGAKAGETVPIWVNEHGDLADPPLTSDGATVNGVVFAVLVWSAGSGVMVLLYLAVRFAHKRIRMRRWASEWYRIAPDWAGR